MKETEIANPDVVRYIVKRFNLRASKKWGQNFLIRPQVVRDIAAAAGVRNGDPVLEIGPGIGTLTQALAETGADITAVEIDGRLLPILAKTLEKYDNVHIIHGDIMKTDIAAEMKYEPFTVCANLPYYITTPVIMRLLEEKLSVRRMVVMVQKEVAERMTAKPGSKTYGALSVAVQYRTEPHIEFEIAPKAFLPPPAVTSAVVVMNVRSEPTVKVKEEKRFFRIVAFSFAQRRKTLSNALKGGGIAAEEVRDILDTARIDGGRRGETLSLEEFAALADAWSCIRSE